MQIGQAAAASGVSAKMIRHYESIGLIGAAGRSEANYRTYDAEDVHRLAFIRRARDLGFSIARIKTLLALWSDRARSSQEVKAIARAHLSELQQKITDLRELTDVLHRLVDTCEGDARPHCPIIEVLEGSADASARKPHPPSDHLANRISIKKKVRRLERL